MVQHGATHLTRLASLPWNIPVAHLHPRIASKEAEETSLGEEAKKL
jgi:hypothetical protein